MEETIIIPPKFERSDKIGELVKARNKAAEGIRHADKKSINPHLGNKYADLSSVLDAMSGIHEHGLAIFQFPTGDTSAITVTTLLAHESDQWVSCSLTIKPDKQTAQGMGSAITYARRYTASAVLGISQADDDGNEASGRGHQPDRTPPKSNAKKPSAEAKALVDQLDQAMTQDAIDSLMPKLKKLKEDKSIPGAEMKAVIDAYKAATERAEAAA